MTVAITTARTRAVASNQNDAHVRSALDNSPVLPPGGDIRAILYQLKMESRETSLQEAGTRVIQANDSRRLQMQKAAEAEAQAKAAQDNASRSAGWVSVLSKVATVAAIVAAAASVVATDGASAPAVMALAGTCLSASSPYIAKECGEDWGKAAMYTGVGLSLAGAGATAFGVGAAEAATSQGSTVSVIAHWTSSGARVVEGSSRIAEGCEVAKQKDAEGDSLKAEADATAHRAALKRVQGDLNGAVDLMREVEASARRAAQTILAIGNELDESRSALVARIGRHA